MPANNANFPPVGLTWFWFLNDFCDEAAVDAQIAEFQRAGIGTVCLHPRDGLLLPYGGDDWFAFIRRTAKKLAAAGIGIWLYDEDPYPSGNAGGRVALDHPELIARKLVMHRAKPEDISAADGLWCFPATGRLLLCGTFDAASGATLADFTSRVGTLRREWTVLKDWDSRWYYPATPLYTCDRAMTDKVEYGVRAGMLPPGAVLAAFTCEAVTGTRWGYYADPLDPRATAKFIEYTHERYRQCVGHMFGREIPAIFTDEAKYYDPRPWTPGMFEDFTKKYGYDLRPRLYHLFSGTSTPEGRLARLHYREWCGRRFEQAWLKPVAAWCRRHKLKLVGHISPEDDPVEQAGAISNLLPLHKHLSLAGLDLIIPAVGDRRHPLLNLGIVSAVSAAQQRRLPGVMSESLGCSGNLTTMAQVRRIINWQTVMGLTTPVVHGIYLSMRGERAIDAPPDFGPASPYWDGMQRLAADLRPVQELLIGATQEAPVAILWPIKSFHLLHEFWQGEPGGLRGELAELLLACLEAQIGVQLLDEAELARAAFRNGRLRCGRAAYSHVILPGAELWTEAAWEKLAGCRAGGLHVYRFGTRPHSLETAAGLEPLADTAAFPEITLDGLAAKLPRLLELSSPRAADIRASRWRRNGRRTTLLMYLGEGVAKARAGSRVRRLTGGEIVIWED